MQEGHSELFGLDAILGLGGHEDEGEEGIADAYGVDQDCPGVLVFMSLVVEHRVGEHGQEVISVFVNHLLCFLDAVAEEDLGPRLHAHDLLVIVDPFFGEELGLLHHL